MLQNIKPDANSDSDMARASDTTGTEVDGKQAQNVRTLELISHRLPFIVPTTRRQDPQPEPNTTDAVRDNAQPRVANEVFLP